MFPLQIKLVDHYFGHIPTMNCLLVCVCIEFWQTRLYFFDLADTVIHDNTKTLHISSQTLVCI